MRKIHNSIAQKYNSIHVELLEYNVFKNMKYIIARKK